MSDFWSSVREALRGSRQDFTEVPIRRAILLLAVPMILEMAMESLFAIVDIFWLSRLDADVDQLVLLLALVAALGLCSGARAAVGSRWRVCRHHHCVVNVRRRGRPDLQTGALDAEKGSNLTRPPRCPAVRVFGRRLWA